MSVCALNIRPRKGNGKDAVIFSSMIKPDFPAASEGLGLENVSCILALMFSYPEQVAVLSDNFFLFIAIRFAECLVDIDNLALHIGNVDAVVGAHYGTREQFEFLFHHVVPDGILDGYRNGFKIILVDVFNQIIIGAGLPCFDCCLLIAGSRDNDHGRVLCRLQDIKCRTVPK